MNYDATLTRDDDDDNYYEEIQYKHKLGFMTNSWKKKPKGIVRKQDMNVTQANRGKVDKKKRHVKEPGQQYKGCPWSSVLTQH